MSYKYICAQCGIEFETLWFDKKYCSIKCRRKARRLRELNSRRPTRSRIRLNHVKSFIYADKIAKGCSRCPERRPNCLQYHHLDRKTKKAGVSQIRTLDLVKEEMAKCILLCANCHAVEEHGDGYRIEEPVVPELEHLKLSKDINLLPNLGSRRPRFKKCKECGGPKYTWQRLCQPCFNNGKR